MNLAELIEALTIERFGRTVPEYHNGRQDAAERLRTLEQAVRDLPATDQPDDLARAAVARYEAALAAKPDEGTDDDDGHAMGAA